VEVQLAHQALTTPDSFQKDVVQIFSRYLETLENDLVSPLAFFAHEELNY
jgi:hypothetical protein